MFSPRSDSYPRPNSTPNMALGSPWSMLGAPPCMCTHLGPMCGCHGHAEMELKWGLGLPAKQLPECLDQEGPRKSLLIFFYFHLY